MKAGVGVAVPGKSIFGKCTGRKVSAANLTRSHSGQRDFVNQALAAVLPVKQDALSGCVW